MDALGKLGINLGLLLANTANLLIMLLVLRLVAYEPIMKMMQTRRERIAEGINNARPRGRGARQRRSRQAGDRRGSPR